VESGEVCGETTSSDNNLDKGRPPPIILTFEVNLPSLQKDLEALVTGEFFCWNTASGTRIITESMADYKALQNFLSQKCVSFFTFYTKGDKQVKAVIRHLLKISSSEDNTVALQELGYEIISVKQMTAKRPFPEGRVSLVSLPQKSLDIFKISSLRNIIVKVEAYKSKSDMTQCYNCPRFGHIWFYCRQTPRCLWCGGGQRHRKCPEKNTQSIPTPNVG
jgi:hypothetical protein